MPISGNMSNGWRHMLRLRSTIRDFMWHKIGNGSTVSVWFDKWCEIGPLSNIISYRDIYRSGLNPQLKVADLIHEGALVWPTYLSDKYSVLSSCSSSVNNDQDCLVWRLSDGSLKPLSVSQVWSSIRPRDNKVIWYNMVWFPNNIPRHAFNLWLIIKRKLKTQDRICWWDVDSNLGSTCSLCDLIPDTHDHLFFDCSFADSVWSHMKSLAGLASLPHNVYSIVDQLGSSANRRSTQIVVAKLVLAASTYFIWRERNLRLFKKSKRTVNQVIEGIYTTVRLKLLSCCFKRSKEAEGYARLWDLPNSVFR